VPNDIGVDVARGTRQRVAEPRCRSVAQDEHGVALAFRTRHLAQQVREPFFPLLLLRFWRDRHKRRAVGRVDHRRFVRLLRSALACSARALALADLSLVFMVRC
jgi:hypothetical protein